MAECGVLSGRSNEHRFRALVHCQVFGEMDDLDSWQRASGDRSRYQIGRNMKINRDLTDSQWDVLEPLIPEPSRRKDGRGRPWKNRRAVLNGILSVLRTGAPWADLPDRYPPYQTCHRRFQQWVRSDILRGILEALAEQLRAQGQLDIREAFIDGSFAAAKKGLQGRKDEARQRDEDHGSGGSIRSPSRGVHRERFASRSDPG
jgi:transposase